jgi:hypothetical protein
MRIHSLLLVAAAGMASAQDSRAPVPASFRTGLPPAEVASQRRALVLRSEDERGLVTVLGSVQPSRREVELEWRYFVGPPAEGRMTTTSSRIAFDGIPTALAALDDGVLIVAGEGRDRRTRLERIDLGPAEIDAQTPSVRAGEPIARRTLWECDAPGRRVIAHLARLPGEGAPRLAALMWDSPEVVAFDLEAKTCSRLAALHASGEVGVLEVPELASTYHTLSVRNHRRHGYVLLLGTAAFDVVREDDRTLVLVDGDRNGTLDRRMLLDAEGWIREGFADEESYVR